MIENFKDTFSRNVAHTCMALENIRITRPCDFYPLAPHFYIVKLGVSVVYIIFLFLSEAVLTCTRDLCLEQK